MKCQFIAVLDDSRNFGEIFQQRIEALIRDDSYIPVYRFETIEALRVFLYEKNEEWGILFMDILIGDKSSIEMAATLKKMSRYWKIVFITGFTDYLSDIFRANPDGLLYKPIDDTHLKETLYNLIRQIDEDNASVISFQVIRQGHVRLPVDSILYIESDLRILHIHLEECVMDTYGKMDDFARLLPGYFVRCHRSFLVNMNRIKNCHNTELCLFDDTVIPISRPYKNAVQEQFLNLLKPTIQ